MAWIQFFYFLEHLSVKMLLLFTIANALVCGNVLLLCLTFLILRKVGKKKEFYGLAKEKVATNLVEAKATFLNMETGKQEKWAQKNIWVKEDQG